MKTTLKIGQKYRVIQDDSSSPIEPGTIITVKKLISFERFYDENDNEWWFDPEYLELIKPKTKKVKKYKYSREFLAEMFFEYKDKCDFIKDLLAQKEDNKECKCVNCLSKKVYKSIICDSKKLYKDLTTPSPLEIEEIETPKVFSETRTTNGLITEFGFTDEFINWVEKVTDTLNSLTNRK